MEGDGPHDADLLGYCWPLTQEIHLLELSEGLGQRECSINKHGLHLICLCFLLEYRLLKVKNTIQTCVPSEKHGVCWLGEQITGLLEMLMVDRQVFGNRPIENHSFIVK